MEILALEAFTDYSMTRHLNIWEETVMALNLKAIAWKPSSKNSEEIVLTAQQ